MFFILLIFIICSIFYYDINEVKYQKKNTYIFIVILLIATSAFRYHVGIDSIRYEDLYDDFPSLSSLSFDDFTFIRYEPLWIIVCSTLHSISGNFILLQIVHSLIINIVSCIFIYRHSKTPFISLFFYYIGMYFLFNFESMRESLAIAIFLLFYEKIHHKKLLYYYMGCFLSVMIHYGAIILFIIPMLKNYKLSLKHLLILPISIFCLVYLFLLIVGQQYDVSLFGPLVEYKYRTYVSRDKNISLYFVLIYLIIPFFTLFIGILLKINKGQFGYLLLIYLALTISSLLTPIMSRLSNYFIIFYIVYLSDIINELVKRHVRTPMRTVWACGVIIIFSLSFTSWFFIRVPDTKLRNYHRFVPYSSIITQEESDNRKIIMNAEF